jgi:hypothetical protein
LAPSSEGLRHLGLSISHGIPHCWNPADGPFDVDLLVTVGMRRPHAEARERYVKRGIPWMSFDMPHVRGVAGDARLYTESHAWLPDVEGLPSRRDRLPVTARSRGDVAVGSAAKKLPTKKRSRSKKAATAPPSAAPEAVKLAGSVLVIGQMPHDSSHGMNSTQLAEWAEGAFELAHEFYPDAGVVWRPHPKSASVTPKGFDRVSNPHQETIAEAIEAARLVCVYSSTAGLEALIAGCPVVAWGPSCYRDLCAKPGEIAEAEHPGVEAVEALLERIAYTQWSLDELATGEPFRFVLEQMGVECPAAA